VIHGDSAALTAISGLNDGFTLLGAREGEADEGFEGWDPRKKGDEV
jgi:hypothetical protein